MGGWWWCRRLLRRVVCLNCQLRLRDVILVRVLLKNRIDRMNENTHMNTQIFIHSSIYMICQVGLYMVLVVQSCLSHTEEAENPGAPQSTGLGCLSSPNMTLEAWRIAEEL